MAPAPGPSRKRKRQSDIRAPLEETSSVGNVAKRKRAATHVQATPKAPKTISQISVELPDETIPLDCCYHCRIRGGQAAYDCFKEEGDGRCTRCIRRKIANCRMPTDEEAVLIAARCPQCTRRGFKGCNGATPCDTCVRRETSHKCRQPTKRITMREHLPSRKENDNGSVQNEQATASESPGSVMKSKGNGSSRRFKSKQSEQIEQRSSIEDGNMDIEEDHHVEADNRKAHIPTASPGSAMELTECDAQDPFVHEHRPHHLHDHPRVTRSHYRHDEASVEIFEANTMSGSTRVDETYHQEIAADMESHSQLEGSVVSGDEDEDIRDTVTVDCETLLSPPVSKEWTEEKSIETGMQRRKCGLPSDSNTRPRRSLVRVSYVEMFEDELLEQRHEVEDENDEPIKTSTKPRKQVKTTNLSQKRSGKGIDLDLPPLNNISDIFADMSAKAAQLGLCRALEKMKGHPINVATMCSGTESPLIALDLMSKARDQAGLPPIYVKHHFSAEIDVMKQGFIQRNFQPEIVFRDARDMIPDGATTATTAFGADKPIPGDLDILIAGFVCKDLSRMNNHGKGLNGNGESGDTWLAVYTYADRFRPGIVLLENVKADIKADVEANVKTRIRLWDDVVSRWETIGYEAAWLYCDTKNYYLPQTRERMYMIAIERSRFGKDAAKAVGEWKDLMEQLRRQCSSPYEAFLSGLMQESNEYSALVSEHDWGLCKLRYDHIRSVERLGILQPLTKCNENGSFRPPDFANRKWYQSQSTRVYDAIDVAHLQAAQKNYDSTSKMSIWDVSQNVDRFSKTDSGLCVCITPDGCDFASNRHRALNGKEMLKLQGMPLDKLLFGRETQKDCQNLAGNAMSTTVIGASLISAIISGWKSFKPRSTFALQPTKEGTKRAALTNTDAIHVMKQNTLRPTQFGQLDLEGLKQDAVRSARLCNCEGDKRVCKATVHRCSACGHTACGDCAGNPKHTYRIVYPNGSRSQTPLDFVNEWRPKLPARLKFDCFPDLRQFTSKVRAGDPMLRPFVERMVEVDIESQYFSLGDLLRQDNVWKATYKSPQARLELVIGDEIQWLLYVACGRHVPGNSSFRKLLEGPVASARVSRSLLDAEWQVFIPLIKHFSLQMSGSAERHSSWKSRLGLPDYRLETVPRTIKIHSSGAEAESLAGEYHFLPYCGTACGSLYKKSTTPALYMFLDPDPIGQANSDRVAFSEDCSRKHFGDARISLAHLEASWRPWDLASTAPRDVNATLPGSWVPATFKLQTACPPVKASVLSGTQQFGLSQVDCSQSITVLNVQLPGSFLVQEFSDYSWALEQAKLLPSFSTWQQFRANSSEQCSCAPKYPRLLWNVNGKGIATAQEDRKAAAKFEHAIKTRPPIFHIQPTSSSSETRIQVGINISSLVHRAQGRLAQLGPVNTAWRLVTDHADLPLEPFPRFRLQSNSKDTPHTLLSNLKYLRGAQPRSLSWMMTQESGRRIKITEVEEAIQRDLGWRAEARAQTEISIRGGVLADLPSFGKTVTTIALIQSEFEKHPPDAILNHNEGAAGKLPFRIDSAATLIVCPPHIALQWQVELKKFLGPERFSHYNVLLVKTFAQLRSLTIEEVKNSRVMIVSWIVFADEEYISHLAQFSGMPEPTTTTRRAYDAWISHVLDDIPGQLNALHAKGFEGFQASTKELLEERLQHDDFQAALPIKVQHGSAYQSFNSIQKASRNATGSKAKSKSQRKRKVSSHGTESHLVPLVHLFRFNRIVVDEYHYLNDDKKTCNMLASVSVKRVAAHKRWVLSGTPALASFTDVDQIASYLGISLGRYFLGEGMVTTSVEKRRKKDQTLVEDFLSHIDIMSRQWHQARHERAQEFLDLFVRQNEAELQHIACSEKLLPIELGIAHHAVYLELSQHLISQRMQIRKLNNKASSDRTDRLNASLNNSATAEDALLKSALLFETSGGKSGLDHLMETRSKQCRQTEKELIGLMAGLEGLKKDKELTELYGRFKNDIKGTNWLGDQESMQRVRSLLTKAEKTPNTKGFPELKTMSKDKAKIYIKKVLSQLREISRELALRKRSERFIGAIKDFVQQRLHSADNQSYTCSSLECNGTSDVAHLYLISHCGHRACEECLKARTDDESCVDKLCNVRMQSLNLIKVSDLGSPGKHIVERDFGQKLEAVAQIIRKLPKDDQGLVFAPNEETINILEDVFKYYNISYHSPSYCRSAASAEMIEDFKGNKNPAQRKKVLILNLGSESAAGVNLINANHVIFVSPLLAKSQYEYDSAMVQAIARSRRYGQERNVHIYHVVAQRTIDVDILEHRHKRSDGITTSEWTVQMPKTGSTKKEKTRLIKNNAGQMALVPASWLVDESKRQLLNVGEKPDSFTSLINFSEAFEHDDD